MHYWILCCLFMWISFVRSSPCKCIGPHHPQEHFCFSDYVIHAKIIGRQDEENIASFQIVLLEEFKMLNNARRAFMDGKIYTQKSTAACGVDFLVGSEVILAGHLSENRRPFINECDFKKNLTELTSEQIRGLNGVYSKGCNCMTTFCYSFGRNRKCTNRRDVECIWKYDYIDDQMKEETCLPSRENQKCFWTQNGYCFEENQCENSTF